MSTAQAINWKSTFLRSDVMVAIGLVAILMVMIIPVPPILLDIFLALNITIGLLILILCLYTKKPLDFSIFPAVLLTTTLFRLSLNVATTRLILLNGNSGVDAAGAVIMSFGQFVVGGNYVVGVVVFAILVTINFVVITKGAGRVAEVAARFTLDALPGKQMAIDADLNAGLINDTEARQRRKEVSSEAEFYGAMDGASKFVRGDAIAGILITLVNLCAGFIIGVVMNDMAAADAAATYTILTVGDGLVGQIPALIISTAAGILVTRTTSGGENFGDDLAAQFSVEPRAIWIVSGILAFFAMIPGLPHLSFFIISAALAGLAYYLQKKTEREEAEAQAIMEDDVPEAPEDDEGLPPIDILQIEVGYGIIPIFDSSDDGMFLERIKLLRREIAMDYGYILPPVSIKDNLQLRPNEYAILLKGVPIANGEVMPDQFMALNPGEVTEKIRGTDTTDPTYNMPATWITEDKVERAKIAGYTVVDSNTVLATHLAETIKRHAFEMVGRQETQELIDNLAQSYPKLVEDIVPEIAPIGLVMKVLQNLLREQVSIRDLRSILEAIAEWAPISNDPDFLTEHVRECLGRAISSKYADESNTLHVITLDRELEQFLTEQVQASPNGAYLQLQPDFMHKLIDSIIQSVKNFSDADVAVLMTGPAIRSHLRKIMERFVQDIVVLSTAEMSMTLNIKASDVIKIER